MSLKVWLVDGEAVRSHFKTDFTQGGHDLVYPWIPSGEVWVEDGVDPAERPFVLLHEVTERRLMEKGMGYDRAHAKASKAEYAARLRAKRGKSSPVLETVHRAPKGYTKEKPLVIAGKPYTGGEVIPNEEMEKAPPEVRNRIKQLAEDPKTTPQSRGQDAPAKQPAGRPLVEPDQGAKDFAGAFDEQAAAGQQVDAVKAERDRLFLATRADPSPEAKEAFLDAAAQLDSLTGKKEKGPKQEVTRDYLKTAKVLHAERLEGPGRNETYVLDLDGGNKAVWKPASGELPGFRHSVAAGTYYRREAAAYDVAEAMGFADLVPHTETRSHAGAEGSVQKFVNAVNAKMLPRDRRYDGPEDAARAAAFDHVIGNTDRHSNNWMVTRENKLVLIDHGLCFPDDYHASEVSLVRNDLLDKAREGSVLIPDLSAARAGWDRAEQALRARGLSESAIAHTKQRFDDVTSGKYKTFGELPSHADRAKEAAAKGSGEVEAAAAKAIAGIDFKKLEDEHRAGALAGDRMKLRDVKKAIGM